VQQNKSIASEDELKRSLLVKGHRTKHQSRSTGSMWWSQLLTPCSLRHVHREHSNKKDN